MNSVGSKGDSYDNALAETIIGLYKAELIRNRGPWRGLEDLEYATSNGSTGSTTAASSKPTARSRPPSTKRSTTVSKQAPAGRPRLKPNSLHETRSDSVR